jgi:hypothetical protein
MGNCLNGDSRHSSVEASPMPIQQQSPPSRPTDSAITFTRDANAHRDVPASQSARSAGGGRSGAPSQRSQLIINMRQPRFQRVNNRTNAASQPNPPGVADSRSLVSAAQPTDRSDSSAGREAALPASELTNPPAVSARAHISQPISQRTGMTAPALMPRRTTPRGEMMNQRSDIDVVRTVPAGQRSQIASASGFRGRLLGTRARFTNVRIERAAAQVSLARSMVPGEERVDGRRRVAFPEINPFREHSQIELLPRFRSAPAPRAATNIEPVGRQTQRDIVSLTGLDIAMTYARTGVPTLPIVRPADPIIRRESVNPEPRCGDTVAGAGDSRSRRARATGRTSNISGVYRHQGGSAELPATPIEVGSQPPKIRIQIIFPALHAAIPEVRPAGNIYEKMATIIADRNASVPPHHARMVDFHASLPEQWTFSHQVLGPEPGRGTSVPLLYS